jgi:hypothetical protein
VFEDRKLIVPLIPELRTTVETNLSDITSFGQHPVKKIQFAPPFAGELGM